MLDINKIRENSELVKQKMQEKRVKNLEQVDELLIADNQWRALLQKTDELRNESNTNAKEIGELMKEGEKEKAGKFIERNSKLKKQIKDLEEDLNKLEEKRDTLLLQIPNLAHESVPVGQSPEDNELIKGWGNPLKEDWPLPHWKILENNGWADFKRGASVTGAGFPFYIGAFAKLQRALIHYFLENANKKGYTEIQAPYFINKNSAKATGQIPDKEDMMYEIPRDGFFPIPTAEVPVTNFHSDEIIEPEKIPIQYAAYTPCWRREAGSYGKEVRGLNRLHQFDKVELVKFVHPDESYEALEELREEAETLLEKLELPYRTLLMCTADMGFTQAKKYDLEVWSPGQQRWLEVSSCSNFESYQARRMQLRYRTENGGTEMLHTLNGSALALPRTVAAVLETYQQKDGSVKVPEVLQPFMGMEVLAASV
jgi:seryl-tRNA synthetase